MIRLIRATGNLVLTSIPPEGFGRGCGGAALIGGAKETGAVVDGTGTGAGAGANMVGGTGTDGWASAAAADAAACEDRRADRRAISALKSLAGIGGTYCCEGWVKGG